MPLAAPPCLDAPDSRAPQPRPSRELVQLVSRFAPTDGLHETTIAGLHLIRAGAPAQPLPAVYEPGLCVVVQGRKRARLGDEVIAYDPGHYLLISVTMLPLAHVVEASADEPYLCIRIAVDPREVGSLVLGEAPRATAAPSAESPRGLRVARVSVDLLDAVTRLLRLLQSAHDAPVLAPLAMREIHYRVLHGELGGLLRTMALGDGHSRRIAQAIEWIKQRYAQPLRIDDVAQAVHMSASTLHHHFKQVTSMSPLQFQKQLRLHHARRLMLTEGLDAAGAGHQVGYESPSQFSREYRRLFGAPPRTDLLQLQRAVAV